MRRVVATGLMFALSVTGSYETARSFESGPSPFEVLTAASAGPSPITVPEITSPTTTVVVQKASRAILDLSVLPTTLPPAVQAQQRAALEVRVYAKGTDHRSEASASTTESYYKGSAVNLGKGQVLTAGHMVRDSESGQLDQEASCSDMMIFGRTAADDDWEGVRPTQERSSAKHGDPSVDDLDLVQVTGPNGGSFLDTLPAPRIRETTTLHRGDPVFFINYEPDSDKNDRSPTDNAPLAAFGGVVLKYSSSNGFWMVLTGMAGYSPEGEPESTLRPGGSGGEALYADGSLVGVSVALVDEPPLTAAEVEDKYGLDIVSDSPDMRYQRVFVEAVDKTVMSGLQAQLQTAPEPC